MASLKAAVVKFTGPGFENISTIMATVTQVRPTPFPPITPALRPSKRTSNPGRFSSTPVTSQIPSKVLKSPKISKVQVSAYLFQQ